MRTRFIAGFAIALGLFSSSASAEVWQKSQIEDLIQAAEAAPLEGLPVIEDALAPVLMFEGQADIDPRYSTAADVASTSLFLRLAQIYATGATDPATVDPNWRIPRPADPEADALLAAISAGERPSTLLNALLPSSSAYQALRAELARLRTAPQDSDNDANISHVLANLERWRWLPRNFPARRIEVLLAQYELEYFDGVTTAPTHFDVIVGAPRTPSPVFEAAIESVTLNPYWDPPASIVTRELAPRFARDPGAATREGFEVLDGAGQALDVTSVHWRTRPFPYHLRQLPGPQNALGRLRFDLPNAYAVYLHDTPSQSLFERTTRAFSHGCIRVRTPMALAAALLGDPWDATALQNVINTGVTQTIPLSAPTPVYVLYLTVVMNDNGTLRYVDDINHRDAAIARVLTPASEAVAEIADRQPGCMRE